MTPFTNSPLPDIPVLKFTKDGGEESTTFAKALADLTQKEDMAKRLRTRSEIHTRQAALLLKEWRALEDQQEAAFQKRRLMPALARAELTRRKTAKIVAKTAKLQKQTLKNQRLADLAEAQAAKGARTLQSIEDEHTRLLAEFDQIAAGVATVERNLMASAGQIRIQKERQTAARAAQKDREADEWLWKANTATDVTLRTAYLLRAEGKTDED